MFDVACLQCKKPINGASSRLVKDSCGHEKCRMCLVLDEEKCQQCESGNLIKLETVIKFENNHPGVITCNGIAKQEASVANQNGKPSASTSAQLPVNIETIQKPQKEGAKTKSRSSKTEKSKINTLNTIPNHISILKDPLKYQCNICRKEFTTKSNISYHMYCTGQRKPFQCHLCAKSFVTKSHLNVHELKHKAVKPHVCNICSKSFVSASKLKRHSILHSSEKSYVCSDCGKSFRSKESLKIHISIHRGEKPYSCRICSASFNNASNLNKHLISHSSEKTHMCDQCGKRFKLKWALTVHRRSHLRIRPFECSDCSKTFVNNKDLERHLLTHLETKAFNCSICMTAFRRKDNLHRHVKNAHPGKKAEPVLSTVKQLLIKPEKPVDNPNAINVITASPACKSKIANGTTKPDKRTGTVINGPVKLAFKTTTFKNNYNIHRDCDYDLLPKMPPTYDLAESVNICQKILSPSSPPTRSCIRTSAEICQKNLSSYPTRQIPYETSFEHKKHAIIKNIKFKLPPNYTNLNENYNLKDLIPLKPVSSSFTHNLEAELGSRNNNDYAELKAFSNAATSVIVNSDSSLGSNVHWRRRTSQNLCSKSLEN